MSQKEFNNDVLPKIIDSIKSLTSWGIDHIVETIKEKIEKNNKDEDTSESMEEE